MDLRELLVRGRGPMVEFLPEPSAEALAELIVAFANGVGGTIVVGMDAQGQVHDDVAEDAEPLFERALGMCLPPFRATELPLWQMEPVRESQVACIVVRPTQREMSVHGQAVYVRSGTQNVRLREPGRSQTDDPDDELYESQVVPGAALDDLDDEIIEEYRRNRLQRGPSGAVLTRRELLRDAGAITPQGEPTVAGLLLFGRNPTSFLPQVGVVIVRFAGTSLREAARGEQRYGRRVEIVGPAARVIEGTWQVLFEELHRQAVQDGLERRETYALPPDAVREAMVNAVCHRDYTSRGQRVEIRLFDDRMEIHSPGALPGHITLDNILDEHYSRNPRLVRGLYHWGYIEELGQGVDIIYDAMRRDHHPGPEFRETGRSFMVTLRNAVDDLAQEMGADTNPRQLRALRYIRSHGRLTHARYRQLCPDATPEALRLDLHDLVERGILLRIGGPRGTIYVLK